MVRKERISTDPGKLREFMIKLNTDAEFRSDFLKSPSTKLENFGIYLTPSAKKEVDIVVDSMRRDISNISALPVGYAEFFKHIGYKGRPPANERDEWVHGMFG